MAKRHRNEVLAGIFIIVSSLLFFLVLFLMGSFETLSQTPRTLTVHFPEVQGLREGDPVYLLGRRIGKVESLEFVRLPDEPARVAVTLGFPDRYWQYITEGASVLIDKSITGNLSVLIRGLEGPPLGETAVLQGSSAFDILETAAMVEETLHRVNGVVQGVAEMLDSLHESKVIEGTLVTIGDTFTSFRERTEPLADRLETVAAILEEVLEENRQEIRSAVAGVSDATRTFSQTSKDVSEAAKAIRVLAERVEPARKALEDAMNAVTAAASDLDNLVVRNGGYIDGILKDLRETSATANNLTAEIRRRPWRLLYKPSEEESENLDLYDAAWAYNLTATTLNLSVQELVSLSRHADRVDEQRIQAALRSVRTSLERQKEAEEKFYALFQERARE